MPTDPQQTIPTAAPPAPAAETAELVEMVLWFRRPGRPRNGERPTGYEKLRVWQPKGSEKFWRQAEQYRVPGMPNIQVQFGADFISPHIRKGSAEEADAELPISDDDLAALERRRDELRADIGRLEAMAAAQVRMYDERAVIHREAFEANAEEIKEQRGTLRAIQAMVAEGESVLHHRMKKLFEQEQALSDAATARASAMDAQVTSSLRERLEAKQEIDEVLKGQKDRLNGSLPERLIDRVGDNLEKIGNVPIYARVLLGIVSHLGVKVPEEI